MPSKDVELLGSPLEGFGVKADLFAGAGLRMRSYTNDECDCTLQVIYSVRPNRDGTVSYRFEHALYQQSMWCDGNHEHPLTD